MNENKFWLKRMVFGGIWAVVIVLSLTLLLNVFLNSIIWGGKLYYYSIQLTFDRCASYFGSAALAVAVEYLSVFALGAAVGLSTLPFAETWTSLFVPSVLHFIITGVLAQIVSWSYQWFGFAPVDGPWIVLVLYLVIYILIWAIRWIIWYMELRKMRKALKLKQGGTAHETDKTV